MAHEPVSQLGDRIERLEKADSSPAGVRAVVHAGHCIRVMSTLVTTAERLVVHDCYTCAWAHALIWWGARMSGRQLYLVLLNGARAAVAAGLQDLIRQVSSQAFVAHHRRWHHLLITAVDISNGEFASVTMLDRVSAGCLNAIAVASYSSESATRGRVKELS